MPVFTSKTSTDPGPFDALRPATDGERGLERTTLVDGLDPTFDQLDTTSSELVTTPGGRGGLQQSKHLASGATDEDGELDHLYRFQEIPVTAEMRRELLGVKLPLASVEQLADTQPPHKSSLSAPVPSFVDRHAPTEPGLPSPRQLAHDAEPLKHERQLLEGDSYSTTAPTLLSVRRKRLRNQRYVIGALAAMILAIFSGVAWRRYTRPPASLERASAAEITKKPRIAGNSPGSVAPPHLDSSAGDAIEVATTPTSASPDDENSEPSGSESATSDSQSAQLGSPATDATSSSPLSADSRSASRGPQPASAPRAPSPGSAAAAAPSDLRATPPSTPTPSTPAPSKAPTASHGSATPSGKVEPGKSKAFDPEELIF